MATACLTLPTQTASEPRAGRFLRAAAQWMASIHRAMKNRRDIKVLASLDDRMLSDMGLTRGDVRDAVSEPLWRDPSAILVMRSLEGRRGQLRRCDGEPIIQAPALVPQGFGETVKWPVHARRY